MKLLNVILLTMVCCLIFQMVAFAAYTISLTDVRFKSIQFKQVAQEEGGSELQMELYGVLFNGSGDTKGVKKSVALTPGERAHFVNDIKPKIQAACGAWGVNVPTWAQ